MHEPIAKYQRGKSGGTSIAGEQLRSGNTSGAKYLHKKNLEDIQQMNTRKPELYAEGGKVSPERERETLAASRLMQHQEANRHKAGWYETQEYKDIADEHRSAVRARQRAERTGGAKKMAEGGAVDSWTKREDNEKGVHKGTHAGNTGMSDVGIHVRSANQGPLADDEDKLSIEKAKRMHKGMLGEMNGMKKPNLYAEGGEVEDGAMSEGDDSLEEDLRHAMGSEFLDACDRKDRKGIMNALEAIVLSCRGKE